MAKKSAVAPAVTPPLAPVVEPEPVVEAPPAPKAEQPKERPKAEPKHFVAKGKSIITRSRGVADAGAEVSAADFSDGQKRIEELVAAGYIEQR